MKKFLFCGDVNSQWETLIERVRKLQASSHGPFHGLFCVGSFFENEEEYFQLAHSLDFPIPTFVLDRTGYSTDFNPPRNVVFLEAAGLETLCGVTVCSFGANASVEDTNELLKRLSEPSYKGCDIMLSKEWPAHVLQLLSESEFQNVKALSIPLSGGSVKVAHLANLAMPRMHFTGAMNICYERSPHRCMGKSGDTPTHDNCTFFYSLAGLPGGNNSDKTGDEKSKRWMKAMSCEPMAAVGCRSRPLSDTMASSVTDCPYADMLPPNAGQKRPRDTDVSSGRDMRPPPPPNPPPTNNSFFFGETRGPRGGKLGQNSVNLTPPSSDASVLFVGGIPALPADAVEDILAPLFPTAVKINGVNDKSFAFVEFSCHQAALSVLTAHIDGTNTISLPKDVGGGNISLGWGKAKGDDGNHKKPRNEYVPASHSDDCWFCLASPVVKVHLVVSVSDTAYLSLPRGGMHDLHVLAVPIECNPNRLRVSQDARRDLDKYCVAVGKLYESINCRLLCYERAIRTKGKDHMQLHCVPVPEARLSQALSLFLEVCSKFKLKFHEIMDASSVEDTVAQLASHIVNPEYFYISIPTSCSNQVKRFLYIHEPGARFTMHFGSEAAAAVIGQPERANWKNCLQDESQEVELASRFRSSFEKYDFTLL